MDEERIITKRFSKKNDTNNEGKMNNARSASRVDITKFNQKDPWVKCQEIPVKKVIERRQKLIKDNRKDKISEIKIQQEERDLSDPKQITKMIKQLNQTMNDFMESTNNEIQNIKEILEQNHKIIIKDNSYIKAIKDETNLRIENVIIEFKELKAGLEVTRSLVEDLIQEQSNEKIDNNIKDSFIHNKRRFRWGVAMLKSEGNKFTRIPLIPQYKYNKKEHRWRTEYVICHKDKVIEWTRFYNEQKKSIVEGKKNIIEAIKTHKQQKENSMIEYRKRRDEAIYDRIDEMLSTTRIEQ